MYKIDDREIIEMYLDGYSINYISRRYYKYKNKNNKPVYVNGMCLYPTKVFNLTDCKRLVNEVIYHYITNEIKLTN